MAESRHDAWKAGALYEPYVGRWSRLVAMEFLQWLAPGPELDWLDVGCGTGALTDTIVQRADPRTVRAVDLAENFISYARAHVRDARVTFEIADAQSLPVASRQFDLAVSGLALNFVPQPALAVREMVRAVRPGGVVGAYVWDYAGKMELMRYFWDAAVALAPDALPLDEARRFPICQPAPLTERFTEAGLADVQTRAIDVPTRFRDFDDYWMPFLGGQGPAPGYVMSLDGGRRDALRDRLRVTLPVAADGSIPLIARAWAVRGRARSGGGGGYQTAPRGVHSAHPAPEGKAAP
jgi:SAM-dependent methyltransferase